jgi:hypothetical protein
MRWLVGVGAPPDKPASTTTAESVNPKTYNNADALLDVARVFLDAAPEDRSGEDRTMVVVHVAADSLSRNRISAGPAGAGRRSDVTSTEWADRA